MSRPVYSSSNQPAPRPQRPLSYDFDYDYFPMEQRQRPQQQPSPGVLADQAPAAPASPPKKRGVGDAYLSRSYAAADATSGVGSDLCEDGCKNSWGFDHVVSTLLDEVDTTTLRSQIALSVPAPASSGSLMTRYSGGPTTAKKYQVDLVDMVSRCSIRSSAYPCPGTAEHGRRRIGLPPTRTDDP